RLRGVGHGACHPARILARLSRPRRAAAGGRMGRAGGRRQELPRAGAVDLAVAGGGDPACRARLHAPWRWPGRPARGPAVHATAVSAAAGLELRALRVTFGGIEVVRGATLAVAPGEVLGLVGESGSGKSVTLRAITGLLPAGASVSGEARWAG